MELYIRLANINFYIHSVYDLMNDTIRKYVVNDIVKPDVVIHVEKSLIEAEYEQIKKQNKDINSYKAVELLIVQRAIAEILPKYDTFLLHGAAIAYDNASYIFTGNSGTGKTTHILQWLHNLEGSYVVNGDKPYIICNDNYSYACGTPWCGKEHMGTNSIVPLRSIIFMERSLDNRIVKVPFKSILPKLLEQVYQPTDVANFKKTLELLARLSNCVSFYIFYFDNFKEDAFRTSSNALINQH